MLFHSLEIGSYFYNQFVSENNEETLSQYLLLSNCIYTPGGHIDPTEYIFPEIIQLYQGCTEL